MRIFDLDLDLGASVALVAALARTATQGDPHQVAAWATLDQGLVASGDLGGGEAALRSGLDATPQAADLWYPLATIRARRGDSSGACDAAISALQHVDTSTHPAWEADARAMAQ